MISIVIPGAPITKKNSQQIIRRANGAPCIIPSKQYKVYAKQCAEYLKDYQLNIEYPVNVKCIYYVAKKYRVDLTNLMAATHDILVEHGVLKDDNCNIIKTVDGSYVTYDRNNPRVEITITEARIEE